MNFNIKKLLDDISIKYKEEKYTHKGAPCIKYKLEKCFFDTSHTNNEACIFQYESGALYYKCFHDRCSEKTWKDVRALIQSEYGIDFGKYWLSNNSKQQEENSKEPPLQFITFYDICKKPVERKSIISGFLDESDQTIISGSGGVGKSMLIFYLAYRLAIFADTKKDYHKKIDKMLFDKFVIPQQRTSLFIQSENNHNQVNIRLNKMIGGNVDNKESLKRIVTPFINDDVLTTGRTLQDKMFQELLINLINDNENKMGLKIDLLFFDPLISYISKDENESSSMRKNLDGITRIAQLTGSTPVVIHHNKKNTENNSQPQYRGSSAIFDWSRNMISLTPEKSNSKNGQIKCIKVKHEKCNNFEMFKSFNIKINMDNTFSLVTSIISPKDFERCNLVRQALKDLGGTSKSQNQLVKVYLELSGVSRSTAQRHIIKAVNESFINRTNIKKGGYIYSIDDTKKDNN